MHSEKGLTPFDQIKETDMEFDARSLGFWRTSQLGSTRKHSIVD